MKTSKNLDRLRKLQPTEPRVETGPVQFGDDWPGTFISGDNSFHFATLIDGVLSGEILLSDPIGRAMLVGLRDTLQHCDTRNLKKPELPKKPKRFGFHKIKADKKFGRAVNHTSGVDQTDQR